MINIQFLIFIFYLFLNINFKCINYYNLFKPYDKYLYFIFTYKFYNSNLNINLVNYINVFKY